MLRLASCRGLQHLTSQDGLLDLGSSTSSSLSMRGTLKREKLIADLNSRRGDFFLKVRQNAFRRLKPMGTGAYFARGFPSQRSLHEVPGAARRLQPTEGSGPDYVAHGSRGRSDAGGGLQGSSGDDGSGAGLDGAGCSRWFEMGGGMASFPTRGSSSFPVCSEAFFNEPEASSFCAAMSSGVGYGSFGLCQGGGLDQFSEAGVSGSQEQGEPHGRSQEARRERSLEEEAAFSKEGKGQRRVHFVKEKASQKSRKHHKQSDGGELCSGLCSGMAFDSSCKATNSSPSST